MDRFWGKTYGNVFGVKGCSDREIYFKKRLKRVEGAGFLAAKFNAAEFGCLTLRTHPSSPRLRRDKKDFRLEI
jgi:hypothetical protein